VHTSLVAHAWPQVPQFALSVAVTVHVPPPQAILPTGHTGWHVEPTQSPEHTFPQAPQFNGLAVVSVHPPSHAVSP